MNQASLSPQAFAQFIICISRAEWPNGITSKLLLSRWHFALLSNARGLAAIIRIDPDDPNVSVTDYRLSIDAAAASARLS